MKLMQFTERMRQAVTGLNENYLQTNFTVLTGTKSANRFSMPVKVGPNCSKASALAG